MQRAQAEMLPDGRRLHLQHGPIDLVIEAFGPGRQTGYQRATRRFRTVLEELVSELSDLRRTSVRQVYDTSALRGAVARRMARAVSGLSDVFITPMAAVAGAVADEIMAEICAGPGIDKAYVNNGGDVAIHLGPGQRFDAAIAGASARIELAAGDGIGGMATSGWGGRSHSRGIADSVTVLAADAAAADAAATMIANAVDLPEHPGIARAPARRLSPDSDLGDLLVTTAVPVLSGAEKFTAVQAGTARARDYLGRGLIAAAYIVLQGEARAVAAPHLKIIKETANA